MELSPSREPANCAATQELPSILWNPNVHYCVHKSPPLVLIMSQINPIHTIPSYLSKILLTFQVPNLVSIFFRLGRLSTESVEVRGFFRIFVTSLFFTVRSSWPQAQPPSWRTILSRPSTTAYSIYSQLPSIRNLRTRHAVVTRDPQKHLDTSDFSICRYSSLPAEGFLY
jgi:hypothetical protein